MALLRSHNSAWRFAEFNPQTGELRRLAPWRTLGWKDRPTDGWYGELGNHQLAVYREDGKLWLRVDRRTLPFQGTGVDLAQSGSASTLRVKSGDDTVTEITYVPKKPWPPLSRDMTANVEEEHFDFGLFVYNISRDSERQNRIAAYPSEP